MNYGVPLRRVGHSAVSFVENKRMPLHSLTQNRALGEWGGEVCIQMIVREQLYNFLKENQVIKKYSDLACGTNRYLKSFIIIMIKHFAHPYFPSNYLIALK